MDYLDGIEKATAIIVNLLTIAVLIRELRR